MKRGESAGESGGGKGPLWATAALVIALVAAYGFVPGFRETVTEGWNTLTSGDERRIERWVSRAGAWGPLLIVLAMTLQMFLIVVPSWLLVVISVLAYGPIGGSLIATSAVAVASSIGYGLGKLMGDHAFDRWLKESTCDRLKTEAERYGFWAVIVARINPLISNDAISLIGGMLRMGFWRFLGATLAGITPLVIAIAALGEDWTRMKSGLIGLFVVSLIGLGIKIHVDKRKLGS